MPRIEPFEHHVKRYDHWFEENLTAYRSELGAIRDLLPTTGRGVEIGVGTGRFAAPLNVRFGIDPSRAMARIAVRRGVRVTAGVGEALPFRSARFDHALMVTTICFLDDVPKALQEIHRILMPGGALVVGFIDRDTPLGVECEQKRTLSPFYREAMLLTTTEVRSMMEAAGFGTFVDRQTLFRPLSEMRTEEPVEAGSGRGAFVVIRGIASHRRPRCSC